MYIVSMFLSQLVILWPQEELTRDPFQDPDILSVTVSVSGGIVQPPFPMVSPLFLPMTPET